MRYIVLLILTFVLNACDTETNTSNTDSEIEMQANSISIKEEVKGLQASVSHTVEKTEEKSVEIEVEPQKDSISIDYIMGKFDPAKHPDFVKIDTRYADKANLYLRKAAYESFLKMHAAAKADGVTLVIRSATRNFNYQKGIWERKWTGATKVKGGINLAKTTPADHTRALEILLYSSMPGTSRHHWGTDVDFNSFNNDYFSKGKGLKEYNWLVANAASYGFCQPYSPKGDNRPNGYEEEKWHWSYLPIAQPLTKVAKKQLKDNMISGFKGAETAAKIGVVDKYVLGINPDCK